MGIREDWEDLAKQLGFQFHPGIEAMFQMPCAKVLVEEQGQNWELAQQAFNSHIARAVLQKFFLGIAQGKHRGHEAFLMRQSTGSGDRTYFRTRFGVLFPRSLDIGLQVYPEKWTGKLSKFFGAQDVQIGSEEFDARAMIKAKQPPMAKRLLGGEAIQRALLALFELGGDCRLDDFGVMYREPGEIPQLGRAIEILDRLVGVVEAMPERG